MFLQESSRGDRAAVSHVKVLYKPLYSTVSVLQRISGGNCGTGEDVDLIIKDNQKRQHLLGSGSCVTIPRSC